MKMRFAAALVAAGMATASCGEDGPSKQTTGAIVGAGLGALAGAAIGRGGGRTAAIIIGATAGALIGSAIGAKLDADDRRRREAALAQTMEVTPVGTTTSWANPQSGVRGTITPRTPPTRANTGEVCRDADETITLRDGSTITERTRSCKRADGSWEVKGAVQPS